MGLPAGQGRGRWRLRPGSGGHSPPGALFSRARREEQSRTWVQPSPDALFSRFYSVSPAPGLQPRSGRSADRMTCHWGAPRAPFAESFRFSVFVHVLRFSQPADLALTLWTVLLGICSSSDFVLLLLLLLSAGLRAEPPASSHFLQTPVLACDAAGFSEAALQPPLTVHAPSAFRAALPVTRIFLLSLRRL